jgi:hypothetical protein
MRRCAHFFQEGSFPMKILSKPSFFLFLLLSLCLVNPAPGSADADHFSADNIPIHQKGYQVEKYVDQVTTSENLTYYVRADHPAAELIEFYDAYFNGIGWRSSFEICQRHWDETAFRDVYGKLQSRQLYTSWQSPQADIKVSLWLINRPGLKQPPEEVLVKLQIQAGRPAQ